MNNLVIEAYTADIQCMSTNEVIETIAQMPAKDIALVAEHVRAREDELLKSEIARRRGDLQSGRVHGLTHEEVFGPLKKKYKLAR